MQHFAARGVSLIIKESRDLEGSRQRGVRLQMVVNWQTETFAQRDRYDAWVHVLNETYGSWDMRLSRNREFSARLKHQLLGNLSVADCICDPCAGYRSRPNISKDDPDVLAIQLTLDGLEHMRYGGEEYVLEAGDIIVWDTTQQMTFQVERQLHKVSVILPLRRLRDWLPSNWHSIPRKISAGSARGMLLRSHIKAMAANNFTQTAIDENALSEATIALLVDALNERPAEHKESLKEIQLERIKRYINENLGNSNLSLEAIANANRISLRYLHWLFESIDGTASQYILKQRLTQCRRDLMNPAMLDRTIATIALSWGFNDPNHFSRRFKQAYGQSASETRAEFIGRVNGAE